MIVDARWTLVHQNDREQKQQIEDHRQELDRPAGAAAIGTSQHGRRPRSPPGETAETRRATRSAVEATVSTIGDRRNLARPAIRLPPSPLVLFIRLE